MSTGDLFPEERSGREAAGSGPLADRMRPTLPEEFVGQKDLMGSGAILRRMIEEDQLVSVIFWGPPGSGKTTLARLIANKTGSMFMSYSAVTSGSREMKEVMATARELRRRSGRKTILFIDEVHRFNKAQQDAFLPYVESGDVVLIGATTENPSFEVNAALLSRSKVFVFKPLDTEEIRAIVQRAIDADVELNKSSVSVEDGAVELIVSAADGDARRALNALEMAAVLAQPDNDGVRVIGAADVQKAIQGKSLAYDKDGEEHYNIISALHKSIRGSDPDASLYWLARMMVAGEDRRYLLRRLARVAVEDVGLADPDALVQAAAARQAFDFVGEPEGDLIIAQLVVYLSMAPKSNALYTAYKGVQRDIRDNPAYQVPLHIRNAPTQLMKDLDYGKGYEYSHDMPEGVSVHSFFPEELGERKYYTPGDQGHEMDLAERLRNIKHRIREMREREEKESGVRSQEPGEGESF